MRQQAHANVLPLYCSFVHYHNLWMVMPYVSGGSVLNIMKYAYPEARRPSGPGHAGAARLCARAAPPGGACRDLVRRAGAGEGCRRGCTCLQTQDTQPCRVRPATTQEGISAPPLSPCGGRERILGPPRGRHGPGRAPPRPGG